MKTLAIKSNQDLLCSELKRTFLSPVLKTTFNVEYMEEILVINRRT